MIIYSRVVSARQMLVKSGSKWCSRGREIEADFLEPQKGSLIHCSDSDSRTPRPHTLSCVSRARPRSEATATHFTDKERQLITIKYLAPGPAPLIRSSPESGPGKGLRLGALSWGSTALRYAGDAAPAQRGHGPARGHPAASPPGPGPGLFPWPRANGSHVLGGAGTVLPEQLSYPLLLCCWRTCPLNAKGSFEKVQRGHQERPEPTQAPFSTESQRARCSPMTPGHQRPLPPGTL